MPTYLFADDTSIILTGEDIDSKIKNAFIKICLWFGYNGLFVNESKTQLLYYTLSHNSSILSNTINITETLNLTLQKSAKFLGIILDTKLNWRNHIDNLLGQIQKEKWALRNLVKIVTKDSTLAFYHSNIMSRFRYGIILWGRCAFADEVFIEQKKMIRILFNRPINSHCKEIFIKHRLLTIPSLYIFETINFAVIHNFINPSNLLPKHGYNSSHHRIDNFKIRLSTSENNVKYSAIQLFNALPLELRISFKNEHINIFRKGVKKYCLDKAFYCIKEFIPDII